MIHSTHDSVYLGSATLEYKNKALKLQPNVSYQALIQFLAYIHRYKTMPQRNIYNNRNNSFFSWSCIHREKVIPSLDDHQR